MLSEQDERYRRAFVEYQVKQNKPHVEDLLSKAEVGVDPVLLAELHKIPPALSILDFRYRQSLQQSKQATLAWPSELPKGSLRVQASLHRPHRVPVTLFMVINLDK